MSSRAARILWLVIAALIVLVLGAQLVPYGRAHTNPPVVAEPAWDRPVTRALAVRACFDCHSNQTRWPWYAQVAPVSWLVQHDVDEGRHDLNFSEWNRRYEEAEEAARTVIDRSMPPSYYVWLHPEARLSPAERDELARGLRATIGGGRPEARARPRSAQPAGVAPGPGRGATRGAGGGA